MRNFYKRAAALAVIALSAQATFAQAADGTVHFLGQITSTSCTLAMTEGSSSTTSATGGNLVVDFGKFAAPTTTVTSVGTGIGTAKTVIFSAKGAGGTGACIPATGTGEKSTFNVLLGLTSSKITSISGLDYIANDVLLANGGTNAILKLSVASTQLALKPQSGSTGTFVAGTSASLNNGTISLTAQLVTSTAAVPSVGVFSAAIPVFMIYQ